MLRGGEVVSNINRRRGNEELQEKLPKYKSAGQKEPGVD